MDTETENRRAYVEALITRLRRHYAERVPIPDRHEHEEESISLQMLQRLYRYVTSEGYGE
jgi:hypothetical protein